MQSVFDHHQSQSHRQSRVGKTTQAWEGQGAEWERRPKRGKDREPSGKDDPSVGRTGSRVGKTTQVGKMIQAWQGQGAEHGARFQKWDRCIINALYYRYHKLHLTKTFCRKLLCLTVPSISSYR